MCLCVCEYMCIHKHYIYVHIYLVISIYLPTYLPTYLPIYLSICLSNYLSISIYTYILYIYIHTYTHIHICILQKSHLTSTPGCIEARQATGRRRGLESRYPSLEWHCGICCQNKSPLEELTYSLQLTRSVA